MEMECTHSRRHQKQISVLSQPKPTHLTATAGLQRPRQRQEMQEDQEEEMREEQAIDQVRDELQEGQEEEEAAVHEDLLRPKPDLLNGPLEALVVANRLVSEPGWSWRWSHVPLGLNLRGRGSKRVSRKGRPRVKETGKDGLRRIRTRANQAARRSGPGKPWRVARGDFCAVCANMCVNLQL